MQIVLTDRGRTREVDVVVHDPDARVADLLDALTGGRDDVVLVADGEVVDPARRLDRCGIRSGSEVTLTPAAGAPCPPAVDGALAGPGPAKGSTDGPRVEVAVVGGLTAGHRALLPPGRWSVGRDGASLAVDHDTVSSTHARLEVGPAGTATIADEGSLNGTWIGGRAVLGPVPLAPGRVARLGAVHVAVRSAPLDDRPAGLAAGRGRGGATIPFNRPPRPAPPEAPDAVDPPEPVGEGSSGATPIGIMAVVAPILFGGAMVAITGQVHFALFLLLSPVMVIGNAIDSRRRGRKGRRRDRARFDRELDEMVTTLAAMGDVERLRRIDEVPDPAELLRRVEAPSTRLWERRPSHHDWLRLRAGIGPDAWDPPVTGDRRRHAEEVRAAVAALGRLSDAPVVVDLAGGGVVGVVGPREAVLAVGRSLVVQATVLHGPADLPTMVLTDRERSADWDWVKWLPHVQDPGGSGRRRVTADTDGAEAICRSMLEVADAHRRDGGSASEGEAATGPATLVVVDDETLIEGRRAPVRSVLRGAAGPVAGIVLASSEDRLPSSCSTVIEVDDADGLGRVHRVRTGALVDDVLTCGVSEATARRAARAMARFDDPELDVAGAGLPAIVALLPLLGLDPPDPTAVTERWAAGGADPDLVAPVGVSEDGVLGVDLVRDGPHGLVAGTTGSGKSELLRSLVAGLAATASPDHCTFVLIDFKGGSAFDRCARLPHTVGMVTDLDAHLAERALRCLEAELGHRERVLRDHGAADLSAYRRLDGDRPPLPRLVVVIDEFATLRAELPDFVESLVGIAQRGRSLGVHLVLATQRPSGAVSDNIRANTNLRIALRVQDPGDSKDVIDVDDAARIGRDQPGRGLARFGPGEVIPVQTALSTGVARGGHGPVEVRPFDLLGSGSLGRDAERTEGPTDLSLLVDACLAAHRASGRPDPRRPWPDPLPVEVDLDGLTGADRPDLPFGEDHAVVTYALADVPDEQRRTPVGWAPTQGNLYLVGLPGSGTTTAALSVTLAATRATPPDELHVYALDLGTGDLDVLDGLPHTGAVVAANDRERQARLVTWLRGEVERRRGLRDPRATEPRILLLVDGFGTFRSEWEEVISPVMDALTRTFTEGPAVGVHTVVTADRGAALPAAMRSLVRQEVLFRLGDDIDYVQAGFRAAEVPELVPGRALDAERGLEVHVARPAAGFTEAVAAVAGRHPAPTRAPTPIGTLPREVPVARIVERAGLDGSPRRIPLGIGEQTLGPAGLVLYEGEHALIAGPARSGRSTALRVAAEVADRAGWDRVVVAGRRSPLSRAEGIGTVVAPESVAGELAGAVGARAGPTLLLIDDAEAVDPDGTTVPGLLTRPDLVVVVAGRADSLRSMYSHWSRSVRQSRVGLLLQPDIDIDGDLLSVRLPRRSTTAIGPGRGYLCIGGEVDLIQLAQP